MDLPPCAALERTTTEDEQETCHRVHSEFPATTADPRSFMPSTCCVLATPVARPAYLAKMVGVGDRVRTVLGWTLELSIERWVVQTR
jgi:hypothetical protein